MDVLGGMLGGSGTIRGEVSVASGAVLSPGNSPGLLSSGALTLNSGSTYLVDIAGTTAGTGYDQTVVTGTVSLGGATLSLNFTPFAVPEGSEYILISNDGTDAVVGRFSGLEDGAIVSENFANSGRIGRISYHAGTGNDVAIIIDEVAPSVQIPTSGDADFEFRMVEETLQVLVNNVVQDTFVLAGIRRLTIGGRVGQKDVLRLNFASTNAPLLQALSSLTIDLGGDPDDDLIINAANGDVSVAHTGVGAGTVTVNALTLPFAGVGSNTLYIENAADLTLSFGNSAGSIDFTDHTTSGNSQVAGTGFTTTQFTNPSGSFTVSLGTNDNSLAFTSLDADFNPSSLTINGGSGANSFSFSSLGAFTGPLNVLGGDGTDS
ncbi:MAG: hypothetical protein ACKOEO_04865, partial [Planctomycetaceae bacterium]